MHKRQYYCDKWPPAPVHCQHSNWQFSKDAEKEKKTKERGLDSSIVYHQSSNPRF